MSDAIIGQILVLEDNAVIALDTEMLLQDLGAENIIVASDVSEGLAALDSAQIHLAFLDINLGDETSEPVAQALLERGVPFAFVTGYDESVTFTDRFPKAQIVEKPFDASDLKTAIDNLLGQSPESKA